MLRHLQDYYKIVITQNQIFKKRFDIRMCIFCFRTIFLRKGEERWESVAKRVGRSESPLEKPRSYRALSTKYRCLPSNEDQTSDRAHFAVSEVLYLTWKYPGPEYARALTWLQTFTWKWVLPGEAASTKRRKTLTICLLRTATITT